MLTFPELQARLAEACAANRPGSGVPHTVVLLPSFSIGESLLSHYADRLLALEHRFLVGQLMLHRIRDCEMIFICSEPPAPEVLDYYVGLAPAGLRADVRSRFSTLVVPDRSHRPVAAKLLDRPDLMAHLASRLAGRLAFIEPWNVTTDEVEVARHLGVPVNGTAPDLWPLGYKSGGRRLLRDAGVPVPAGSEDVRTVDDVVAATMSVHAARPLAPGVVVKLDDSGAGDGNMVVPLEPDTTRDRVEASVRALPLWYLRALHGGGIVEELLAGGATTTPSTQVDISPDGTVTVLATHEQVVGGPSGQVYLGCTFPARLPYAAELARHGAAVGEALARRGARGRFSLDFVAVGDADGRWRVYGLEINLRKGGTTHPYTVLRNLAPGRYDPDPGQWLTADGTTRSYCATDNLVDAAWLGLPAARAIAAVRQAGLAFDPVTRTGVVLHMLSGLAIDGRMGLTAIGRGLAEATSMLERTRDAVQRAAGTTPSLSGRLAGGTAR